MRSGETNEGEDGSGAGARVSLAALGERSDLAERTHRRREEQSKLFATVRSDGADGK